MEKVNSFYIFSKITEYAIVIISMILSYLFYSSLSTILFYSVIYGIMSVFFDAVKVILLKSDMLIKRILAYFFVAFSVIACVSIALADIEASAVATTDNEFVKSIQANITVLDSQIQIQGERIKNTSANYGTASQKESEIYMSLLARRDAYQKELTEYKAETKSSEKIAAFETISNLTHINVKYIMLFLFTFRAALLEIAIIVLSLSPQKKKDEFIALKKPQIPIEECKSLLAKWTQAAKQQKNETLNKQFKTVNEAVKEMEGIYNKNLYEKNNT